MRDTEAARRYVDRVATRFGAKTVLECPLPREDAGNEMPRVDMVVSFGAPANGAGWEGTLRAFARQADKLVVVVVGNPDRIGAPPGERVNGGTLSLAPLLWEVGRVREHEYLCIPRIVSILGRLRSDSVSSVALHGPLGAAVRRSARLHAFVVDVAPRTPQARRRLRTVEEAARKESH